MNLESMSKARKIIVVALIILPMFVSIIGLVIIGTAAAINAYPGEMLAPIDNKPMLISLILFTAAYLFFIGMIFSENILNMLNKRRFLSRR